MLDFIKPDKHNWRHYFAGMGLLMLILQIVTGIILTMFYDPTLKGAYKSVQYLTNVVTGGSLSRNLHRWIAFTLFLAVFIHTVRTTFRKDFMNPSKKVAWLTGVLLVPPTFLLIYTGLVLPWEWKGYWFMEMIPNYFREVPFVGDTLFTFFLDTFTLPRYLVIHILILPIIGFVLVDYHFLSKLRRRGIFRYMTRHFIIALPFMVALVLLSIYVTIPSQDPDIIPLPLEGAYIPEPEWWGLLILLPFLYFKGFPVTLLSFILPVVIIIVVAFLPYYLTGKEFIDDEFAAAYRERGGLWNRLWHGGTLSLIFRGVVVTVVFAIFFALVYLGNYNSPTLGCNSCHNLSRGFRMGVPPDTFKDREKLPNLDDNPWMMGHWYYPNEIF